ncbi:MAG: sel1 repeat family protein, partial [Alphaproteobacteria bacterium]|nr:sel1 repeat family protein [Alphaproteobacteria bacterium]
YYSGAGVPRDDAQSLDWFRKAAAAGQPTAQFFLGLHYLFGRGVTKDAAFAHAWCDIAMSNGYEDALYCREEAASQMKLGDRARSAALSAEFYRKQSVRP